jgi:hypothetical protein
MPLIRATRLDIGLMVAESDFDNQATRGIRRAYCSWHGITIASYFHQ